jgi:hypothetical protein
VEARLLHEHRPAADAADHWGRLARENGHFGRVDAELSDAERAAILGELELRLTRFEEGGQLSLPRTLVLVTARRTSRRPT